MTIQPMALAPRRAHLPAALLSHLLTEATDAIDHDRDRARQALTRAVALLAADRPDAQEPGCLAPWQARKAAAHIESHLTSPVRIDELAAIVRLSRSYFSRAFKASFGQSPLQFMQDRRIAHAQQAMLDTDNPLCDIALACGFADQAHLSRMFRRVVGQTPNGWRRARQAPPASMARTVAQHSIQ